MQTTSSNRQPQGKASVRQSIAPRGAIELLRQLTDGQRSAAVLNTGAGGRSIGGCGGSCRSGRAITTASRRARGGTSRGATAFLLATATTTVMPVMTTTVATTASVTRTAAAVAAACAPVATVAAMASNGCLLTAQQGDADDREKDRDGENQHAIHPNSSNYKVPERKGPKTKTLPFYVLPPNRNGLREGRDLNTTCLCPSNTDAGCPVSLCGLRSLDTNAQSRLLN
jgi:hypothetical protein